VTGGDGRRGRTTPKAESLSKKPSLRRDGRDGWLLARALSWKSSSSNDAVSVGMFISSP